MNPTRFGPREALVRRELDRIGQGRWLQPDALLDDLGGEGRAWLSDRLDELLAALTPWCGDDALPDALSLRVTRSMHEAERSWREAWEQDDAASSPGAALRAFTRAGKDLDRGLSPHARATQYALERYTREASRRAQARLDALSVRLTEGGDFTLALADFRLDALVARHLEWTLSADEATPSPFGPLLEVWLRGALPMVLPGDVVMVYVPVEHEGRVVPWLEGDPVEADRNPSLVRHGPRRRPVAAASSAPMQAWWNLGISFPLTFEVKRFEMVTLGARAPLGVTPRVDDEAD